MNIGRDHWRFGTDAPSVKHQTSKMVRTSSDMAVINIITLLGMSLPHNGGGNGIGSFINGGFGLNRRKPLDRWNHHPPFDTMGGLMSHGNDHAIEQPSSTTVPCRNRTTSSSHPQMKIWSKKLKNCFNIKKNKIMKGRKIQRLSPNPPIKEVTL